MNCNLPEITYPALRTLLRFKLYEVIYPQIEVISKKVFRDTYEDHVDFSRVELLLNSIPLKRSSGGTFLVTYQSAIALKLSSVLRRDSLELSYQILEWFQQKNVNFCQEGLSSNSDILSDFTGQVLSSGLLQFELGDRGLSIWLQSLMKLPSQPNLSPTPSKPLAQTLENCQQLFVCQHSHARCFSLLRLAQESTIAPNRLKRDTLDNHQKSFTPDLIPWLAPQGHLCLTHPAERSLISQLVTIGDDLADLVTKPRSCLRSAFALSQAFQSFYGAFPIELTSLKSTQRSQARLGLVMATQRSLNHLLEVGLSVKAPSEL